MRSFASIRLLLAAVYLLGTVGAPSLHLIFHDRPHAHQGSAFQPHTHEDPHAGSHDHEHPHAPSRSGHEHGDSNQNTEHGAGSLAHFDAALGEAAVDSDPLRFLASSFLKLEIPHSRLAEFPPGSALGRAPPQA